MADILLVEPTEQKIADDIAPFPMGLLFISTLLHQEGYKIKIIDRRVNSNWKKELITELKTNPICVGVTTFVGPKIINGLEVSHIIKEYNPDTPIVWGGAHSTLVPELTIKNENIDIVVEGDASISFYKLVKALEYGRRLKDVKGLWYKENGQIKQTGKGDKIDLNALPDPPYALLDIKKYIRTGWHIRQADESAFNIVTSRGCPYNCAYCYNQIVNPNWTALSEDRVIDLLKMLIDDFGAKRFIFTEDNFFMDQKRTNKIMETILKEKMDIEFGFFGITIKEGIHMKEQELKLLESAGCKFLQVGLESGSPRILKLIKKNFTIDQAFAFNKKLGICSEIIPYYNLMTGFPTETIEDIKMTVNTRRRLTEDNPNARTTSLFLFAPWPKTELYTLAVQYGFRPPETLEDWGNIGFVPLGSGLESRPWLTKEMIDFYKRLFLVFWLNKIRYNEFMHYKTSTLLSRLLMFLYKPIADIRFNNNFYDIMPEMAVAKLFKFNE
jgi:radical SAM superfamily enzyme YgiQ (UPF0313 family)